MMVTFPERFNVLGVGVNAVSFSEAVDIFVHAIESGRTGYVCLSSVHPIVEAVRDYSFRRILNRSLLTLPDGMPLVWVGRLQRHRRMERVYGPDFMLAICEQSVRKKWTHFLYGGKEGVGEALKKNLERKFPGIRVCGTYCPPFRDLTAEEEDELQKVVSAASPDIMWVGISSPKQEKFMASHSGVLKCRMMVGVGAAFDLHTGRMRDAPKWMKEAGLQWFHRLTQEPFRLGRRYIVTHPTFVFLIMLQLSGLKKFQLPPYEHQ